MATKATQLASLPERMGIVETKVESLKEQIIDLKSDVKDLHDCLDNTRDAVLSQLDSMSNEYRANAEKYYNHANNLNQLQTEQHDELAAKIGELEKLKNKWTTYTMVALAFAAGTGWLNAVHLPQLLKFVGL